MVFHWQEEAEKAWDRMATNWNKGSKRMWEHGSRKDIIPFLQKYMPQGKVLDIGCGDGYGTHVLSTSAYESTGIDISEKMITLARDKRLDPSIVFKQADIYAIPFSEKEFDGILAINVFEWVEHPADALEEVSRVLHSGGFICLGILGPTAGPRANSYPRVYGEEVILNTVMPWEWKRLLEEKGFTYIDGFTVPKKEMQKIDVSHYPWVMQQALSFMTVAIFQKEGEIE